MSIYRLQHQPGALPWNRWFLDHRAPLNRIRIADALDDGEFSHPFTRGFGIGSRLRPGWKSGGSGFRR